MTEGNEDVRELPKGWIQLNLEDVAEWGSGGTPSRKNPDYFKGNIPWIKTGELKGKYIRSAEERITEEAINESSAKIFPKGSVAIAMYGATIGKTSIIDIDASTNQACAVAKPLKEILFNEFLYYYLSSQTRKFVELGKGGAQPNISQTLLKSHPIPLPPINEQERIVEKIEELFSDVDQGVESLKTAQKQLKVYRQAVLKWAFEGKLTEAWRTQQTYNSPVILKAAQRSEESQTDADDRDSSLRVHSAQNDTRRLTGEALLAQIKAERENRYRQQLTEWEEKVREWEAIEKAGKKPTKPQKPKELSSLTEADLSKLSQLPDSWVWIRIGSITECLDSMRIPINKKEREKRHGDIPYYGANGRVGWIDDHLFDETLVLVVEDETFTGREKPFSYKISGKSWVNNHAHILRSEKSLDINYLNYQLFYYPFTALTTGTTGRKKLTQDALINAPIRFCSIEEQEQIVEEIELRLSTCDQLEATIIENLQKAEALRQSILKQAFEGKLVPQDPNDEPAETLLERIKAERQAMRSPKPSKQLKIKGL